MREYDVTSGSTSIDHHDIREVTLTSLFESVSLVSQPVMLLKDTIQEIIRYSQLRTTREEIEKACAQAAIHNTIKTFPQEYNTTFNGNNLS
ncbi:hypothetical protein F4678DRAFT_185797 [Xylaria arbuscula]|nr:hypothetical protein F4678DRAFT_185797 [Xylaria arbuscula]